VRWLFTQEGLTRGKDSSWCEIAVNQTSVNACEENYIWAQGSQPNIKVQMPGLYTIALVAVFPMCDLTGKKPNLKIVINGKVVALSYAKSSQSSEGVEVEIKDVP
jgi:hypothetical protein